MKQAFYFLFLLTIGMLSLRSSARAQNGWTLLGPTQNEATVLNYYKLLQINATAHRYASIIEITVQGDPTVFNLQGTYSIQVNKHENTANRFDGLEVRCTSGNPAAATFYIYNDALWIRSNFYHGNILYRTEGDFGANSPLNAAPFGQTTTTPAGYAFAVTGSVKCDFDNNTFTRLPATDYNGDQLVYKNISLVGGSKVGTGLTDVFAYDGKSHPHYGFQWVMDSWNGAGYSYWLSSYSGIKMFTTGAPRLVITSTGNVGIGTTTPQAKLAVNGDIVSTRVKVTQQGWPDFVFEPAYKLPSLQEVEAYIKTNKHLPDVPSAAEVTKGGLDLGEMNKILLQKIEELTLHVIEQNKRISELEKQVNR